MSKAWKLNRTQQCDKCPWKVSTDPTTIPNEYSLEQHRALASTIAAPGDWTRLGEPLHVMACHETHDAHCVGWLHHQLGRGNNLALRIGMLSCTNADRLRVVGAQHESFEDTLPKSARSPGSGDRDPGAAFVLETE